MRLKRFEYFINESNITNKNIINVDIQPEYKDYITFNLQEWGNFINQNYNDNSIIFLYNGLDTLGMISEGEYKDWLMFDVGISEEILYSSAIFYDKGYAFFRYCLDYSIDEDQIVSLIKFMMHYNINDSRDINSDMWNDFMDENNYKNSEIRELLEFADDAISIPDLMDFLQHYSNILLLGGGVNECLKEVEIALKGLDKRYDTLNKFIY